MTDFIAKKNCYIVFEIPEKETTEFNKLAQILFGRIPDHITPKAIDGFMEIEYWFINFKSLGEQLDILLNELYILEKANEKYHVTFEISAG